jgi:uncharacterized cofD-like protein
VTATPLTLHARIADGSTVDGQSQIMRTADIERVWITPDDVQASDDALAAIADADLIVIGPGSLYTSLLPSLLIPVIRDAVLATAAPRVYVCNVATQEGETTGMHLAAHVAALVDHTAPGIIDVVLANNRFDARVPTDWQAEPVRLHWPPDGMTEPPHLVLDDVVDPDNAHHHDAARLAAAVLKAGEAESPRRRQAATRTA